MTPDERIILKQFVRAARRLDESMREADKVRGHPNLREYRFVKDNMLHTNFRKALKAAEQICDAERQEAGAV